MLEAYFDESRKHDKITGCDIQVTVGGAIAHECQWIALSAEWEVALAMEGFSIFHMSEFESRRGEFRKWHDHSFDNERKNFLNKLLNIISRHILCIVGSRIPIINNSGFAKTYAEAVKKCIYRATLDVARLRQENIALFFAVQPEVSYKRIVQYCDILKNLAIPNLASCAGAEPKDKLPLQVADLLSYEIMKWDGENNSAKWRYPLRKLRSGTVTFNVF